MDFLGVAALVTAIGALVVQLVQARRVAKKDAVEMLQEDYERLYKEYAALRRDAQAQMEEIAALKTELCLWRSGVKVLIGQLRAMDLEPAWEPPGVDQDTDVVFCL